MMNILTLLDEVRAIATTGLNYTTNPYDIERYERLLELAAGEYAALYGLEADEVRRRFRQDVGYITVKSGATGAVFNEVGHLLLVKRSDDRKWCLPTGWIEPSEVPEEAVVREVKEETGLDVRADGLIAVHPQPAGAYGNPHSHYTLLYHCVQTGGTLTTSHETLELGYFPPNAELDWHGNHAERFRLAFQWRNR
jgi:ADP-ribose pyrophosphatase YjhB (NUDIX family)